MALNIGIGDIGYENQWYLQGFDPTSVPAQRPETAQADSVTVFDTEPFGAPGRVLRIGDQVVYGVTAPSTLPFVGSEINYFTVLSNWNTIKNVLITSDTAEQVQVNGAVHVDVALNATTTDDSYVSLLGLKRGNIVTGNGDDLVYIETLNNNDGWVSEIRMTLNEGNDTVQIRDLSENRLTEDPYKNLNISQGFNTDGEGQKVFADLGEGDDTFDGAGSNATFDVRGFNANDLIVGGNNDDNLAGDRGNDTLYGGYGDDVIDTGYEAATTEEIALERSVYTALQNNAMTPELLQAFYDAAEYGDGGHGTDALFSFGKWNSEMVVDGMDVLQGYKGGDYFYFVGEFGTDVVNDFVGGARVSDPEVNQGDRLMYENVTTGNNSLFTFQTVNFDGGSNDLLISWGYNGEASGLNAEQGASDRAVIVKDFFTLNTGVIDTSGYAGTKTVAQLEALGANNIFNFSVSDHAEIRTEYNFFGGLV